MIKILVVDNKLLHHPYINNILLNKMHDVKIVYDISVAVTECSKIKYDILIIGEHIVLNETDFTSEVVKLIPDIKIIFIVEKTSLDSIIESVKKDTYGISEDSVLEENNEISSIHTYDNNTDIESCSETTDYSIIKENVIRNFEISFIKKYLQLNKGNVAATARAINFHPVSLRQKIAKLGIRTVRMKSV
jgi:DNA-binding NtrC family response regulator